MIGRHAPLVQLQDSRVSRLHAEISRQGGVWLLRDNDSSNGVYVNGKRVRRLTELEDGDEMLIGRLRIRLKMSPSTASAGTKPAPKPGKPRAPEPIRLELDESVFDASDDSAEMSGIVPASVESADKPSDDPVSDDDVLDLISAEGVTPSVKAGHSSGALDFIDEALADLDADRSPSPIDLAAGEGFSAPEQEAPGDAEEHAAAAQHRREAAEAAEREAAAEREKQAQAEAEAKAKAEAEAEAEAKAKAEAEAAAERERQARETAEQQAQAEADKAKALAEAEAEAKAKQEAEAAAERERQEREATQRQAQEAAEQRAKAEAEEAERRAAAEREEAERLARVEAEAAVRATMRQSAASEATARSEAARKRIDLAGHRAMTLAQKRAEAAARRASAAEARRRAEEAEQAARAQARREAEEAETQRRAEEQERRRAQAAQAEAEAQARMERARREREVAAERTERSAAVPPPGRAESDAASAIPAPPVPAEKLAAAETTRLPRRRRRVGRGIGLIVLLMAACAGVYFGVIAPVQQSSVAGRSASVDTLSNATDDPPQARYESLAFNDASPQLHGKAVLYGRVEGHLPAQAWPTAPHVPDVLGRPQPTPPQPPTTDEPAQSPADPPEPAVETTPEASDSATPKTTAEASPETAADGPADDAAMALATPAPGIVEQSIVDTPRVDTAERNPAAQPTDPPRASAPNPADAMPSADATPSVEAAAPDPAEAQAVPATGRRLAVLIDASGSTIDSMPRMVGYVGRMLDQLRREDQFTVLFYRDGEAIEAVSPGLKTAEPAMKRRVWDWMQPEEERIIAGGRSDAIVAIQLALSYGAQEMVILSDNTFGGRRVTTDQILAEMALVIDRRQVKINTVQFFYRDADDTLRKVAETYGGTFEFIKSEPENRGPDPLKALSEGMPPS